MPAEAAGRTVPAKTTARTERPYRSRYDLAGARDVGLGEPPSLNVRTAIGAVDDPYTPGARVQVTIHRNVDPLENELSRGRISEAAYLAGCRLKRAYERLPAAPNRSNWQGGTASIRCRRGT
jgi:hypothetical protein